MQTLLLPHTNLRPSALALGAMLWGTSTSYDAALELYDTYRAAGGNTFDTAHIYAAWIKNGEGLSEKTLGQILRTRNERHNLILITKGAHPPAPFYKHPNPYLTPKTIHDDITDSLHRLDLPSVDLFLLHRDDRRVSVSEIICALNEQLAGKRIKHFGVSNWSPARIEEANAYAHKNHLHPIVCSQPKFSLALPNSPEQKDDLDLRFLSPEDIAWHTRSQLPAFCYSPTANGYFATNGKSAAASYQNPSTQARLEQAKILAQKHHASPNQIALAWLLHQPFPAIPLLGTGNLEHLTDALAATHIHLTPEETNSLTQPQTLSPQ